MLHQQELDQLIQEIKKKKELQSIDDHFVEEQLRQYLQQEPRLLKSLQENFNPKSKAYTAVIKHLRSQLRRVYGLFRDDAKERKALVQKLLVTPKMRRDTLLWQILSTHSSTQERLPFYQKIYAAIFSITGRPKSILDLGSGINPFSFSYMNLPACAYYAYDINKEEINFLNQYFQLLHRENPSFTGKAVVADIMKVSLSQADLCLLFKMTDVLDKGKGHKKTEELLIKIPAKYVVISFATKTMSGKVMTAPRRSWVEWLCKRFGYEYKVVEFPNEIMYVIKKNSKK